MDLKLSWDLPDHAELLPGQSSRCPCQSGAPALQDWQLPLAGGFESTAISNVWDTAACSFFQLALAQQKLLSGSRLTGDFRWGIMHMGCRPLTCQLLPCSRTMVVARASAEDRRSQVSSAWMMAHCRTMVCWLTKSCMRSSWRALSCPLSGMFAMPAQLSYHSWRGSRDSTGWMTLLQ